MSNYCRHYSYDPAKRTGPQARHLREKLGVQVGPGPGRY